MKIPNNNENILITNSNEFFTDTLANYLKSTIQKDKKKYSIGNIALWFKIMHETENLKRSHMWDIHSLSPERLSKIVCQDSSFNSIATLDYIQKGIL